MNGSNCDKIIILVAVIRLIGVWREQAKKKKTEITKGLLNRYTNCCYTLYDYTERWQRCGSFN